MQDLPVRVSRVGGEIKTFDEHRLGYKKVGTDEHPMIAQLIVPPDQEVVYPNSSGSWNNTKLRTREVYVNEIVDKNGCMHSQAPALHRDGFEYVCGEKARADGLNRSTNEVSGKGIHLFPTFKCAYYYCHKEHNL